MNRTMRVARGFLAIFGMLLGIAIGGGLYEQLVVMPLWSAAPPESVLSYYQHNVANPRFALNQGGTFWAFVMPLLTLSAIGTLLSGLRTRREHRKWRIGAVVLSLCLIVVTGVWFIPNIRRLLGDEVTSMPAGAVVNLTTLWVRLNWIRSLLFLISWIAALRALTISPVTDDERNRSHEIAA
jgi:hypothetical protein